MKHQERMLYVFENAPDPCQCIEHSRRFPGLLVLALDCWLLPRELLVGDAWRVMLQQPARSVSCVEHKIVNEDELSVHLAENLKRRTSKV
jgi:hypothetical protein